MSSESSLADSGIRGVSSDSGDTIIVILVFLSISFYKSVPLQLSDTI